MSIGGWIKDADKWLFYLINKKLSVSALNEVMLLLREAIVWIPVYLFFLTFFYFNCRKFLVQFVMLTLLTFALADFTSATILKPFIGRLRPCQDPSLGFDINNIAGCGGIFSMPSSHASNHFGLATFWFLVMKHVFNSKWFWLWGWALIIGYAQIYVGVHYPGDILAGALLGIGIGNFTFYLFKKWTAEYEVRIADQ